MSNMYGSGGRARRGPRGVVVALLVVGLGVGLAACQSESASEAEKRDPGEGAATKADTGGEGAEGMAGRRNVYGLPLPPQVTDVRRFDTSVKVYTKMSFEEVVGFFRARLQNYEILKPRPGRLRIVGLYEFMPAIKGHEFGPLVILNYVPKREPPDAEQLVEADAGGAGGDDEARGRKRGSSTYRSGTVSHWRRQWNESGGAEPGKPVRLRTPEGELLAPGAHWGEPYTPPPGTPLHKETYRENFGEPFGEWTLP